MLLGSGSAVLATSLPGSCSGDPSGGTYYYQATHSFTAGQYPYTGIEAYITYGASLNACNGATSYHNFDSQVISLQQGGSAGAKDIAQTGMYTYEYLDGIQHTVFDWTPNSANYGSSAAITSVYPQYNHQYLFQIDYTGAHFCYAIFDNTVGGPAIWSACDTHVWVPNSNAIYWMGGEMVNLESVIGAQSQDGTDGRFYTYSRRNGSWGAELNGTPATVRIDHSGNGGDFTPLPEWELFNDVNGWPMQYTLY